MLECPEDGELPEAEEADRLPAREAMQTPDVKPICQSPPVILPQSVDIPEHANNGFRDGGPVIAQETAEDEICHPLGSCTESKRRVSVQKNHGRHKAKRHAKHINTSQRRTKVDG